MQNAPTTRGKRIHKADSQQTVKRKDRGGVNHRSDRSTMPSPFSEMGGVTSDVVVGSSRQQPPKKKPRQKAKGSANADVAASQLPAEGGSEVSQAYHQRHSVDSPPMDTKTTSVLLCAPSPQLTSRADPIGTPVPIPHRIVARTVDTSEASATARVPPRSEGGACSMDATPEAIPLPLSSPAVLPMPQVAHFAPFTGCTN